ncbi:MAG: 30S ribosomal protein S12 methylthiotransferase RimO, partial [Gammaproteobacteria bacterium]|nr:30S ribosomal protein S12 methylthiotransferase RimO [Gammaproteobacteria bacterium]
MSEVTVSSPKVGFVSLGCPKALVDSERILTQLRMDGYEIVSSYDNADIVVVNTCGFIDSARVESLQTIGEAINENGKVIVTGCLGVYAQKIRNEYPQVLSVSGPQQYEQVVSAVHEHAPQNDEHDPYTDLVPAQGIKLTPRHYSYLKISEGCNHHCSFCIIPSMRGRLVSRPVGEVMNEAEGLVKAGVKELLVISQDTSAYGSDIKYQTGFWQGRPLKGNLLGLCHALAELGVWVRLHYVYPYPHVDEIIPLMTEGKLLPYLDVPFQHGSPSVLKAMRRPAAAENTLARIKTWREICPDISIRSTFIVGFPGESDVDFGILLEFLQEAQLDRVGCFQYSPVEGARANELAEHVADDVKQERWERFMQAQQVISANKLQKKIGQTLEVLIDKVDGEDIIGRSHADAPEIDGIVFVRGDNDLLPGDLVKVKIDSAGEYDLWGAVVDPRFRS